MGEFGTSIRRLEDSRLLRGTGTFVDTVQVPGELSLRVVRSPVAHGRVRAIDATAARALPGVVDVITANALPAFRIPPRQGTPGVDFEPYLQAPLAGDYVRYFGDPVAAVLATDPYTAEDAAAMVMLDIEPLRVSLDARTGQADVPASLAGAKAQVANIDAGYGDVDAGFAAAAHVVRGSLRVGRHSGTPLETRGMLATWDDRASRMTIYGASKVPYWNRRVIAQFLGLAEHQIHMPASDVGGSFGIRGELYPEDLLVPFLCLRHRRPVKWVEDRAEHLVAANHAREQEHEIELAFDSDLRLLALRDEAWLDTGAYIRTHGAVVAVLTAAMMAGPYRLPAVFTRVHIVTTNKTPVGTYRAPGRFQNTFVREHLMDVAASELGVDPIELRRVNLLTAAELPMTRPMQVFGAPMLLDGTDHLGHFDKALSDVGFAQWRAEARTLSTPDKAVGVGCAVILEKAGLGHDNAVVTVDTTGAVRVAMGGTSSGQGIETVMAQIAAETLRVPVRRISVVLSDTDILTDGAGTFASRSTVVGGTAVVLAAEAVVARAREVAAAALGTGAESLRLDDGRLTLADEPGTGLTYAQIAGLAQQPPFVRTGTEPGLVGRGTFAASTMTYPYGAHFAQVEVDRGTGAVRVLRYAVSYEIGRSVHPAGVRGQLAGGAVQGIGGALWEEFLYDEAGVPLVTSLDTYRWPRAADVPVIDVHLYEDSPAPGNPLGMRGAGEGGVAGCGGAIANAVRDALGLTGDVGALPLRPDRVVRLLEQQAAELAWRPAASNLVAGEGR